MHFVGAIQPSNIRKVILMHFSKGKLTEEDENYIASTLILEKNLSTMSCLARSAIELSSVE